MTLSGLSSPAATVEVVSEIQVNVTEYLNGAVTAIIVNSTLKETGLLANSTTTVDLHFTTDLFNTTDSNYTPDSNSTVNSNYAFDSDYTTDPTFNYTLEFSMASTNWTEGNTTTETPRKIIIVNDNSPPKQPTLNETSTSQELENKLNKAEKIGAIVGSLMAIFVLAVIIAIYFLYRKH
ncbi:unnamed protein product [Rodentolepis nana]|uniref:Cadherin domain-containing protein n=1 Tax=Rodentolepis nana TaxID=102285 RepID=A0A0R3T398_RODNA|nr:unnamed protein product [Rodentolepis nana]